MYISLYVTLVLKGAREKIAYHYYCYNIVVVKPVFISLAIGSLLVLYIVSQVQMPSSKN